MVIPLLYSIFIFFQKKNAYNSVLANAYMPFEVCNYIVVILIKCLICTMSFLQAKAQT